MSLVRHLALASLYVLLAIVVTVIIWSLGTPLNPAVALIMGVLVLVSGALLHENYVRRTRDEARDHEMRSLRGAYKEVVDELSMLRKEFGRPSASAVRAEVPEAMRDAQSLQEMASQISRDRHAEAWEQVAARSEAARRASLPRPMSTEERTAHREALGELDERTVVGLLRECLRKDRLDLFTWATYRLPARRETFHDCRIHLRREDGTHVTPEQYWPIAAEHGILHEVENNLLARTFQLIRTVKPTDRETAFFCRLSGPSLSDKRFLPDFISILEENAHFASRLVIEVTQQDSDEMGEVAHLALARLANSGYRYCLGHLQSLDLDFRDLSERRFRFAKVPAPLLMVAEQQKPGEEVARGMRLAMDRDAIDMIVDHIADEETLRHFLDTGIQFGQGPLFGSPTLSAGDRPARDRLIDGPTDATG